MIRYWWRKLRNRCIMCNKKKENHLMCFHCTHGLLCHNCGKLTNFSETYGMGKVKLLEVLQNAKH